LDFGADITGVLAGAALAELFHDRIHASVFADRSQMVGDEDDPDETARLEEMRTEMMAELRVLLREELASVQRPGRDAPVGPSPAEESEAVAEARPLLRH